MTEPPDYSGVTEVPVSEAAERLPSLVDKVLADDLFVYLTRDGERVAVIMPTDIGEGYERADDEYWAKRAAEARSRLASGEEELIPYSQVIADSEGRCPPPPAPPRPS